MASVWEHSRQKGTALLMLLAIADNANDYGEAWPAVGTLARKCRMTVRNAQMLIKQLQEAGELVVSVQEGFPTATGKTNIYTIITPGVLRHEGAKQPSPLSEQGVKAASLRGEKSSTEGVKPTSPRTVINEPSLIGGDADEPLDAAAALIALKVDPNTARKAAAHPVLGSQLTPQVIEQIKAWKERPRKGKAMAILVACLQRGELPDDLEEPKNGKTPSLYQQAGEDPDAYQRRLMAAVRGGA